MLLNPFHIVLPLSPPHERGPAAPAGVVFDISAGPHGDNAQIRRHTGANVAMPPH
jgi:hypothetical protein